MSSKRSTPAVARLTARPGGELRATLRLAGPLVLAELGWKMMDIVDTAMVGRLGAEAIGAVSIGGALFFAVAIFGGGLLLGLDTLVAQAFGAGRIADCHRSLLSSLYIAVVLAPLLMLLVWGATPLLPRVGVHPAVVAGAIPYLNAITWSIFPLLLYFAFRRYLQGMSVVKPVTFALITANLVNVAANWALIFGNLGMPALGTEGAGWATCVSRTYMALVLGGYILWHDRRYGTGLWRIRLAPEWARIRRLLALGFPVATQFLLEMGVFATATALIAMLDPVSLAAHHIALSVASLTFMVPLGISSAAAVRVGQNLGAGDALGAGRAGWTALALSTVFMSGAALAFFFLPGPIIRLFTTDASVLSIGVSLLLIAGIFQLCDGLQVVATGALRGAGDTRTPMLLGLVFFWMVGLPLGYWLCFQQGWGAVGMWVGLCLALVLLGAVLLWVWRRRVGRWQAAVARAEALTTPAG